MNGAGGRGGLVWFQKCPVWVPVGPMQASRSGQATLRRWHSTRVTRSRGRVGGCMGGWTHLHHHHPLVGQFAKYAWCMESLWHTVDMACETPRLATCWTAMHQCGMYSPLTRNKAEREMPLYLYALISYKPRRHIFVRTGTSKSR